MAALVVISFCLEHTTVRCIVVCSWDERGVDPFQLGSRVVETLLVTVANNTS